VGGRPLPQRVFTSLPKLHERRVGTSRLGRKNKAKLERMEESKKSKCPFSDERKECRSGTNDLSLKSRSTETPR